MHPFPTGSWRAGMGPMTLTQRAQVADSADVDPRAAVGAGTRVWHLAQVREGAEVGDECIIGRGAYVGPGVVGGAPLRSHRGASRKAPAASTSTGPTSGRW